MDHATGVWRCAMRSFRASRTGLSWLAKLDSRIGLQEMGSVVLTYERSILARRGSGRNEDGQLIVWCNVCQLTQRNGLYWKLCLVAVISGRMNAVPSSSPSLIRKITTSLDML